MRMVKSYRLQPRLAEPRIVVLIWEFERQAVLQVLVQYESDGEKCAGKPSRAEMS